MKSVIFDMDGLILDSERLYFEAAAEILPMLGYEFKSQYIEDCVGKNVSAAHLSLKKSLGEDFDADYFYKLVSKKVAYYKDNGKLQLKPGVLETFAYFKENKYKIGLATSTFEKNATDLLKYFNLFDNFEARVFGDMVEHSKPCPDIILKSASILGVNPADTIVLEDSFNGVSAGHAGGFKVVMIPDILKPTDEIRKKCTEIHASLNDFLANSKLL